MNLALFDFDGTITTGETWPAFMRAAIPQRRQAVGMAILAPVFIAYKLGAVSVSVFRSAATSIGLRGVPESEARQTGEKFSRTVLPGLVRPIALEKIKWHKSQGDIVVVISASLDLYLSDWCKQHEVDLICTELETRNGVLTGRFRGKDCCGPEKVKRILAKYDLGAFPVIYGYGDTPEDRDMLNIASKKYYQWQELA